MNKTKYHIWQDVVLKTEIDLVCKCYDTELQALYALKDECELKIKEIHKILLQTQKRIDAIYEDNQNNLG